MSCRGRPSTGRMDEKNIAVPSGVTNGSMSAYVPENGTTAGVDQRPPGRRREVRISARSRVPGHQPSLCDQYASVSSGLKDRKSTRLNSSHVRISYAVFCLKKKKKYQN